VDGVDVVGRGVAVSGQVDAVDGGDEQHHVAESGDACFLKWYMYFAFVSLMYIHTYICIHCFLKLMIYLAHISFYN
jgi:hypothetical protein